MGIIPMLLLLGSAWSTPASEPLPEVPPSVAFVVSAASVDHTFRVVVLSGGREHVSSQVYLQWLGPASEGSASARVVDSIIVDEVSGGMHSVGLPKVEVDGGLFRVVLETTLTWGKEEIVTLVSEVPGEYRVVQ